VVFFALSKGESPPKKGWAQKLTETLLRETTRNYQLISKTTFAKENNMKFRWNI
jgi:hypothetical protein